jgi:segregation and condensation protein B
MEKGLVKMHGREEVPGKPMLYGTADGFLQTVGLNSLTDLPRPEELK